MVSYLPTSKQQVLADLRRTVASYTKAGRDRALEREIAIALGFVDDVPGVLIDVQRTITLLLAALPKWWIVSIGQLRTPVVYKGDKHAPIPGVGWRAVLQHENGGYELRVDHVTPARALLTAILDAAAIEAK